MIPNIQGQNGFTPLHCASQGGHMNIIQYLITELGCDPTTLNSGWQSSIALSLS